ncbi:MAG: DNA alkylation repair protein [Bacillota bacterium]
MNKKLIVEKTDKEFEINNNLSGSKLRNKVARNIYHILPEEWAESEKIYVRRAAPVSLLESTRSFKVNVSFSKVLEITEILKDDNEIHVQKGVGWLLKYAYLSYPEDVYKYLENNVKNLSRTIFRYALEKAPANEKEELMNLEY